MKRSILSSESLRVTESSSEDSKNTVSKRRRRLKREDSDAVEALIELTGGVVNGVDLQSLINKSAEAMNIHMQHHSSNSSAETGQPSGVEVEEGKSIKGAWCDEEDRQMMEAVARHGTEWRMVSGYVKGRTPKQCRDRYRLKLDPAINHGPWSSEEDDALLRLHSDMGRQWTKIAKQLPGRTENAVKSRYASLFRSQTKEWSLQEEQLLSLLHSQGVSFEDIAKNHMPLRSEHSIRKRWEKMVMQHVADEIKQNLPSLNKSVVGCSEDAQRSNVPGPLSRSIPKGEIPKLNPLLAASTNGSVRRLTEATPTKVSYVPGSRLVISSAAQTPIPTETCSTFTTPENMTDSSGSSTPSALIDTIEALNANSENSSPNEKGPQLVSEVETEPSTTKHQLSNKNLDVVKGRRIAGNRLKRYSTSTTVMMQILGEPLPN